MILALLSDLLRTSSPLLLLERIFAIWMCIDAIRRQEWLWAVLIFVFPFINPILYFFLVYRQSPPTMRGLELPGSHDRKRIKELQDQIHHLDKAHHHLELGDVYFQQGKLEKAEACYRASLEREPDDLDARAHYGQCLLRLGRPQEARKYLQGVIDEDVSHDFGHTAMALAETQTLLGQSEPAMATWRKVLETHTYARARVQLAELLAAAGQTKAAQTEAREVLADEAHTPEFQRRRDRVWINRAKTLLRQTGA